MAMSKAETLPQEIIIDILSRLPAKFVGQYRCVSKQWLNFLSDPQFIKFHLTIHADKLEKKLIYVSASNSLHTITFNHNPQNGTTDAISRKLNFQQLSDNWVRVVGSCNGLVLVVNDEMIKYLINPTSLNYHRIPNFHLALPLPGSCSVYGLGYDFATDDYKVVTLSRYRGHIDNTFVDVYSVRMGLWRRLECIPHDHIAHHDLTHADGSGVLVNGALHWVARKAPMLQYSSIIVAFDLTSETFSEVPSPTVFGKGNLGCYNLVALRGCLCMYITHGANEVELWIMREYRVEESWTEFRFKGPNSVNGFIPLCLMSNDDVVLSEVIGEKLIICNMKEDQWRDMMVDGITSMLKRTGYFMESLDTLLVDAIL